MWHGILGHDDVVERFRRMVRSGRLASTYLFVGPPGIGKRRFALELARSLMCSAMPDEALAACGECESCRLFAAGNHPDLELIGLPPDKTRLPIELFVGDREHRHQEGLCHRISLKPFLGRRKVAIIDDADHFSQESANCLLKTLEEPPAHSLLVLIGTSASRQLPTIRSRAQLIRFRPLEPAQLAQILAETGITADREQADGLAKLSEGSVERARQIADPALWEFRTVLLRQLTGTSPESVRLARAVQEFVDGAGKDAGPRRERLRIVVGFAIEHYRETLRRDTATDTSDATATIDALDASLDALEQIDRNANLALVVQHWCDAMAGVSEPAAG